MDSSDLVARENEFKKLNKQLEKKTKSLMKEIESVMQKQDIFSDISHKLRLTPSPRNVEKHCCDYTGTSKANSGNNLSIHKHNSSRPNINKNKTKIVVKNDTKTNSEFISNKQYNSGHLSTPSEYNSSNKMDVICNNCMFNKNARLSDDIEFVYAFVSINVKDNILPQSFLKERVTVESVCKFLSAKVKLLQEQITKMKNTMEKKGQQCEGHLAQIAELEGARSSLINRANKAKADAAERRAKYTALQAQLEERDRLYKEQRSATDKLCAELKQLSSERAALLARCAAHETKEAAYAQRLAVATTTHQEFRDSSRNLSASHESAISRLEARIKQLTNCVQKQNALIDNLKQQNALLSVQGATTAVESEYNEFLKRDL